MCPLTTDPTQAPIFRLSVQPSARSGLRAPCRMMVDRLTAVPRRRLGTVVGSLTSEEVKALNRAIFVFLGLAGTEASQKRKARQFAVFAPLTSDKPRYARHGPNASYRLGGTGSPINPVATF